MAEQHRPPPRLQSAEPAPVVFRVAVAERGLGRHELHDGRGQRRHAQASPAQTRRAALFVARVLPTTEEANQSFQIQRSTNLSCEATICSRSRAGTCCDAGELSSG